MKQLNTERESRETGGDWNCCLTGLAEAVARKTTRRVTFRSSIRALDRMGGKTHEKVFHEKKSEKRQTSPVLKLKLAGRLTREQTVEDFTTIRMRKASQKRLEASLR